MDERKSAEPTEVHAKRRAILRLILGQLQIVGATFGLFYLFTTGVSRHTIVFVTATGVVSIISRSIFGWRRSKR